MSRVPDVDGAASDSGRVRPRFGGEGQGTAIKREQDLGTSANSFAPSATA